MDTGEISMMEFDKSDNAYFIPFSESKNVFEKSIKKCNAIGKIKLFVTKNKHIKSEPTIAVITIP